MWRALIDHSDGNTERRFSDRITPANEGACLTFLMYVLLHRASHLHCPELRMDSATQTLAAAPPG